MEAALFLLLVFFTLVIISGTWDILLGLFGLDKVFKVGIYSKESLEAEARSEKKKRESKNS